jgi:hypothetical protein
MDAGCYLAGVKRQGREADHWPLSSAEVKTSGTISLGRGHIKETGNRNATVISENCCQPELNTCY